MKKLIVASLAAGILAAVPISGFAGQTIDATHLDLNGNGCTQCHFSMDINTGLEIVPGDTCGGCHINETGGYSDNSAPYAASHKGFTCQTCHNPHVSLEYGEGTPALVSGTITSAVDSGSSLTLTYDGASLLGDWAGSPAAWAAKTMADRGLILWETVAPDNYSFKVSAADNATITVEGGLPAGLTLADLNGSFELHYGQLIARAVDPATSTYRDANGTTAAVDFPSMGTTGITAGNMFVNETGNGICQRCHTTTAHWNSTGNDGHNVAQDCTDCHKHDNKVGPTYGFGIDTSNCVNCHTGYPEPPQSGAHAVHASPTTGYVMACATCHKGGMNDQMGYIPSDGNVQIGINLIGRNNFSGLHTNYDGVTGTIVDPQNYGSGYEAKNDGTVTTNGTTTCSNVYCHSNGRVAELGCLTGEINEQTFTSPRWDGADGGDPDGDGDKCNNCHPQVWPVADTNRHWRHVTDQKLTCSNCHAGTVANDGTITNKTNHANGSIELLQGGTFQGSYDLTDYATYGQFAWDPATKTCATVPCHSNKAEFTYEPATCKVDAANAATVASSEGIINTDPVWEYSITNYDRNTLVITDSSYDFDYIDPVKNAAYGSGYTGGKGKVLWVPNGANGGGNVVNLVTMPDAPTSPKDLYRSFPDEFWNYVAIPGSEVINFNLQIWDNSPDANANRKNKVTGPGVGYIKTGWVHYVMQPVDEAVINQLPIIVTPLASVTDLGGGNYQLTLTDQTIDKDWNDPAKNALFGGGHDGSTPARIKVVWYEQDFSQTATNYYPTLQDVYTNTPMTHIFNGGTFSSGSRIYYSTTVWDSHYQNSASQAAAPTQKIGSGWMFTVIP